MVARASGTCQNRYLPVPGRVAGEMLNGARGRPMTKQRSLIDDARSPLVPPPSPRRLHRARGSRRENLFRSQRQYARRID